MRSKKETISTKLEDGTEVKLDVLRPVHSVIQESQKVYNKTFSEAVKSGAFFRQVLQKKMEDQGIWDEAKEREYRASVQTILDSEEKLKAGKISKWEGRTLALKMRDARTHIAELISERTRMDSNTAEGQADNARFNFLVSECTVYNEDGQKYFKSLDDYLSRSGEQASIDAASTMANILYDYDKSAEDNLLENKFLKKFNFVNEKLELVNEDGKLVDEDGRLIDEEGFLIDETGERLSVKEVVDFDKIEFYD
jgi:hypothetical protein